MNQLRTVLDALESLQRYDGTLTGAQVTEAIAIVQGLMQAEPVGGVDIQRQQLAEAQRDAERYRFLRDHFATKSENSVDDFIALEPMTGEYFDAHIDILMSEFYADKKGTA